jgi:predicted transcriptional regulator
MKRLLVPVSPELHKRLKMMAVVEDTTLEAITRAALEAYVSKQNSN